MSTRFLKRLFIRSVTRFMDGLGVERIPDPTTAGDFARRFAEKDVVDVMAAINSKRPKLSKKRLSRAERKEALVDVDGSHALTLGECKEGIGAGRRIVYRILGYNQWVCIFMETFDRVRRLQLA